MTSKEALQILQGNFCDAQITENQSHSDVFQEAFAMAIASLEKQIPLAPEWISQDGDVFECPRCRAVIVGVEGKVTEHNYCLECGQSISWGNEDD